MYIPQKPTLFFHQKSRTTTDKQYEKYNIHSCNNNCLFSSFSSSNLLHKNEKCLNVYCFTNHVITIYISSKNFCFVLLVSKNTIKSFSSSWRNKNCPYSLFLPFQLLFPLFHWWLNVFPSPTNLFSRGTSIILCA